MRKAAFVFALATLSLVAGNAFATTTVTPQCGKAPPCPPPKCPPKPPPVSCR